MTGEIMSGDGMRRPPKPLEELALDLLFESYGESRYNRTTEEYQYLSSLVRGLKDAHYRVNNGLKELKEPRWSEVCYFKPGDATPRFAPFPKSVSMETIRNALISSGFREPRRRKKTA